MFHTHGEAVENWAQTTGETVFMGNMAVVASGSSSINYYWEIYSIMGDPSLSPYYGVPTVNTITYPATVMLGLDSINITAAPYSRVALSMNGVLNGTAIVGSTGSIALPITPFSSVGTAKLVVTRSGRITRIENIQVVPASGPYMSVETTAYADGNNNQADYNESGTLNVTFKNVGSSTASNVTATLSCNTAGITITDNTEAIASLSAGSSLTRNGAYALSIANNVSNGTVAAFTITMVSGSETWTHNFSITLNAPALALGTMSVNDASGNNNGRLDPGETVTISIPLTNSGGAASPAGSATLSSSTNGITINTGTANFSAIAASGSSTLSFNVSVSASMSSGSLASFVANATAGAYSANSSQSLEVGTPEQIVIGSGTSTQTYPLERYYNYSTHEAIYLASEIGMPGTISALAYYKSSGTNTDPINSTSIYMKTTSATTLSTGDYSTSGYSLVYSGSFPNTATSGWMEVELSTPFEYNGTANLSILVVKAHEAYISSGYPNWSYTSTTTRARQARSDSAQPVTITATSNLPNLRLKIFASEVEVLNPPQNLSASASHQSVALSWQAPAMGTPTGYKIFKNGSLLTSVSGLSYTDTAVSNGTTYSYYLKAVYSGGDSDATSTVTATPNAIAPTNLVAVAGNSLVNLSWTAATGRAIEEDLQGKDVRSISGYKVYRNSSAIATTSSSSYQDTGLSNGTSYSYYVTTVYTSPTGESAPSNTATATPQPITEVILGTGTTSTSGDFASPINVYYKSLHGQAVYTAAELTAAGISGPIDITQLGFNITGLPTRNMPNFVVRMKHTSASNVSSWINSTGLVTVYSNASYIPTQTGYNMYTLSTPFTWNGTDNILIDTAFNIYSEAYSNTGTVQYTSTTNGYRYTRSDTVEQANTFSDESVSGVYSGVTVYRPNVKLILQAHVVEEAVISIDQASISFNETMVGNSTAKSFIITNTGNTTLSGSIVTPTGFSVSLLSARQQTTITRNSLNFQIDEGDSKEYELLFTPSEVGNYSGNVVISSNAVNDPTLNIGVSGNSYTNQDITVEPSLLSVSLETGTEASDSFTISNLGSRALNYTISVIESERGILAQRSSMTRGIGGSTMSLNAESYLSGTTVDWTFTVRNGSTDAEWLREITMEFPTDIVINSVSGFVGGRLPMPFDQITNNSIRWYGTNSYGNGVIWGNQTASATVNVTIPSGFTGTINLPFVINGDGYNSEPHTVSGAISVIQEVSPVEWLILSSQTGSLAGGADTEITASFSAINMPIDTYQCLIRIASNDPETPVLDIPVTMQVTGEVNHAPTISLPESFSFDRNSSLTLDFGTWVSDPDDDLLSIQVSGNTNVIADIQGLSITFTANQNWFGSETLSFTVSDGELTATDTALMTVNTINLPQWEVVQYPNNPVTIYADVTVAGQPAQLNDWVAAFVNGECRGSAEIVITRESAHATILVNLAEPGERVYFKVYSYATDTIYDALIYVEPQFGEVIGGDTPLPIETDILISLTKPMARVESDPTGVLLKWDAVLHADYYKVYASDNPYTGFEELDITTETEYMIDTLVDKQFFYVKAFKGGVSR